MMEHPPAEEFPDDVEPTDKALKDAGVLDDTIHQEQEYLDDQRTEEAEVSEQDPANAGPFLAVEGEV